MRMVIICNCVGCSFPERLGVFASRLLNTSSLLVDASPASFGGFTEKPALARLLSALQQHYDDLVAHVRRHIGARGGDRAVARDIVHDVCVELIEAPPASDIRLPLAFLREVMTRRAIDHYRVEQGRRAWVESVDELPECADASSLGRDPAEILLGRQWLLQLVRAIEALPPRCREVFVMHKIHEYPQVAVADHLGISVKTVEKHVRLGMEACRRALPALGACAA